MMYFRYYYVSYYNRILNLFKATKPYAYFISYTFDPLHAYKTVIHMILPVCKKLHHVYGSMIKLSRQQNSIPQFLKTQRYEILPYMEMKDTRFMGGTQDL